MKCNILQYLLPRYRFGLYLSGIMTLACSMQADSSPTAWQQDPKTLKELTDPDYFAEPMQKVEEEATAKNMTPSERINLAESTFLSYKYARLRKEYIYRLVITIGAWCVAAISFFVVTRSGPAYIKSSPNLTQGLELEGLWDPVAFLAPLKRKAIFHFLEPDKLEVRNLPPEGPRVNTDLNSRFLCDLGIFFLAFQILLRTPLYLLSIFLASKEIGFLLITLHYFFVNYEKHIRKPWHSIQNNEFEEEDAGVQEIELLYVRSYHRLPEDRCQLIQEQIFELRRHPSKKKKLATKHFVENVVALPTKNELNAQITPPEEIGFDEFSLYGQEVQIGIKRLIYRYYKAIGSYPTYLLSPPGWGKTHLVHLFAEKLGAGIATLKLERGVTLEELIGRPAVGDDVGDIGLLAKSMIKAMNQAEKKSLVLFIDELDKVVHNNEIIEFILKHFDGINRTYKSPYLEGAEIDLPPIIIFAGNKHLTISDHENSKNALSHRTRIVELQRYSWEQQTAITEKMLPFLMEENLGLPYRPLSLAELEGWRQALEPFRKEQEALPSKEKNGSIRPFVKKSIIYLTKMVHGTQIKEIRSKMDLEKASN